MCCLSNISKLRFAFIQSVWFNDKFASRPCEHGENIRNAYCEFEDLHMEQDITNTYREYEEELNKHCSKWQNSSEQHPEIKRTDC